MRVLKWLGNLSLQKKLVILLALAGIIPLMITFSATYGELRNSVITGQNYAANQSFDQTLSLLSSKFSHIEEVSSMITIDEQINAVFSKDPEHMQVWEQLSAFERITDYTRILQTNSEINGIVYYINDDFVITGPHATMYRPYAQVSSLPWVRKIVAGGGEAVWVMMKDESSTSSVSYLALGRVLWNINDYSEPVGIVTLRVELPQLQPYIMNSAMEQLVYLDTDEGEVVLSNGHAELEQRNGFRSQVSRNQFEEVKVGDSSYIVRDSRVGSSNLFLHSVISPDTAATAVNKVRNKVLLVHLLVCLALLVCIIPVTKSITSRIFLLMNRMSQVRQGRLNTLDIPNREDEVGHLVSSYNYMINSVRELMDNQYRLGQDKKGAELRALQSQINPHFLYNTLDMIVWMAQKEEKQNVQQVVYALSDYYKLILNKGEDFVTLRDELRLSEIYVSIQQKRFKGKIQFDVHVDEAVMECMLPKITLQPLVENAIVHGILEKPESSGIITITGGIEEGRVRIVITDDGPGLEQSPSRLHRHQGSGYGVHNIRKRLEFYYNETDGMHYESAPETGTSVIINVPMVFRDAHELKQAST
ncbi:MULTISPECIES: sensor histidine kinase [unclassified Paenibacillus]|uniref:sensor histidine kinase n=1 Tax=unclassified Paenibacillus TaxID=185978 RepID=UPI0009A64FD6|nr:MULTISPECIES: sensor histidine kinase [unclassified Paenibacillus]SLJ95171.1 two-component system, sensor histidine kinase YesM [Paenibacillus sp. RU5A]SOC67391.1 two-component system, sensor histidine kinase YesM [Paenibacillus sp. RU26A]SOC69158.1 two-component system, sensor histidine kinase YesM [Paenibacillus sp. RU5M]